MSQERVGYTAGESYVILNSVTSQLKGKSIGFDEVGKIFRSIGTNFFGGGCWVGIQNNSGSPPKSHRSEYIDRLEQEGLISLDEESRVLTVNETIPIDHHLTAPKKDLRFVEHDESKKVDDQKKHIVGAKVNWGSGTEFIEEDTPEAT